MHHRRRTIPPTYARGPDRGSHRTTNAVGGCIGGLAIVLLGLLVIGATVAVVSRGDAGPNLPEPTTTPAPKVAITRPHMSCDVFWNHSVPQVAGLLGISDQGGLVLYDACSTYGGTLGSAYAQLSE